MVKYIDEENHFKYHSDEDLIRLKDKLVEEYKELQAQWGFELSKIWTDKFDQYTKKGQKKLEKFTKKYADKLSDIEIVFEELKQELNNRNIVVTDLEDITDEEEPEEILSEYEYLKKEEEKTKKIQGELDLQEEEETDWLDG